MIRYADYTYYAGTYGGAVIDTASFTLCANKATAKIKLHTFNRVSDDAVPDEVKMCCCELADAIYTAYKSRHPGKTAEKTGEASVSYESDVNIDAKLEADTINIINNWLAMTGLLYRGCNT